MAREPVRLEPSRSGAARDRAAARWRMILLPAIALATFGVLQWSGSRRAESERPRVEVFVRQVTDAIAAGPDSVPPALAMSEPVIAAEVTRRISLAARAGRGALAVRVVVGDPLREGGAATHTAFVRAPGSAAAALRLVAEPGDPVITVIGVEDAPPDDPPGQAGAPPLPLP